LLLTSLALAASLNWVRLTGAEDCIGSVELAAAVEHRLGRPVFVAAARAGLAVEGRVEPRDGGYAALLKMTDSSGAILGSREVKTDSPSCRDLDGSLVLVLSVMIEPALEPPPAPPPPPPAPLPLVIVVAPPPPEKPGPPWRFGVEAGPTVTAGLTPAPALGLQLELTAIPLSGLAFGLGGRLLLPQTTSLSAGASANVYAGTGRVSVCPRWELPRGFELAACAGAEVGGLRVEPVGLQSGTSQTSLLVDAMATANVTWVLADRAYLRLGAGVLVPFHRDTFTYTGPTGDIGFFQPSAVAGEASLSIGLRFP
jgi:hypothetical protein